VDKVEQIALRPVQHVVDQLAKGYDSAFHPGRAPPVGIREGIEEDDETAGRQVELIQDLSRSALHGGGGPCERARVDNRMLIDRKAGDVIGSHVQLVPQAGDAVQWRRLEADRIFKVGALTAYASAKQLAGEGDERTNRVGRVCGAGRAPPARSRSGIDGRLLAGAAARMPPSDLGADGLETTESGASEDVLLARWWYTGAQAVDITQIG
jgi:hypothetical protein